MYILVALYRILDGQSKPSDRLVEGVVGTPVPTLTEARQMAQQIYKAFGNSLKPLRIRIQRAKKAKVKW
jgi:hypothetical protein